MTKVITRNKKFAAMILIFILLFTGCATKTTTETKDVPQDGQTTQAPEETTDNSQIEQAVANSTNEKIPKYIFLFIGDGMSFPQITSLGYYNGTIENDFKGTQDEPTPDNIPEAIMPSFTEFPVVSSVTSYDASKFITDSASAATAIACGVKTLDGMIGLDPDNNKVTSIAETLKAQAGYKIGILTSVSLDHATPAGFYAHVASRSDHYNISLDLVKSDFDFFAGGGFLTPTGEDEDQEDIIELAKAAGYKIANTYDDINGLDENSGKTIAINPKLDSSSALDYTIDRDKDDFGLDTYVKKAIDVLGEEQPFFIMTEGGKVDWACHANDGYTTIQEIKDLEAAVNVAVDFANEHPDETLILVTGDHETGGFTMGYGGTSYDTYMHVLQGQNISFQAFVDQYIDTYRENGTPFETAMQDVKELFGLIMPDDPDAEVAENQTLVLTESEVARFREAYALTMIPSDDRDLDDADYYSKYAYYEPLQIEVTHLLNGRAGLGWTTNAHTGLPVAFYAKGTGQDAFSGSFDNTEINGKIQELVGINKK